MFDFLAKYIGYHLPLQQLVNYVEESRLVMTWIDFLDIAFMGVLISISLVWLQKKTARSVLFIFFPLLIAYGAAKTLKMQLTLMIFKFGLLTLAISVVVIFQEDFRRVFETLANYRPWRKIRPIPETLPEMLTECLTHFSENKIGGLVVIQGRESVERFVRGGILLKGLVSGPLLQSIFDNHSPGHDGGVLILNGILDKFAVHLPLSRNAQGMGRLGTRHSAALGLSEKCDALILVVSEESGTISLGKNGKLTTVKSKTALSEAIRDHLKRLAPIPIYKGVFRIPWLRLSTSLALSFSLWITLVRPTNLVQRTMEVPIFYRNLPKLWEAKAPDPSKVKITLMGPEGVILPLGITDVAGTIDLGRVREGQQGIALSDLNFNLPYRIRVMNIEPREIAMQAYPVVEHELPVRVIWSDSLGRTPNSQSVKITPAKISVKLPRSTPPPAFLETEPVSSAQLRSGKMQVKLRLSPEIQFSDVSATRVELAP